MEIKIYTLASTRDLNDIRYVGKTKQTLKRRLQGHLCDAKKAEKLQNYKNHNYNWINQELKNGYDIVITELDSLEFQENEDWKWFEQYWISQMKIWGFKLTNLTDGGDGNQNQHFSKETIELRASKIRGIPRDEETKRKISKGLKGITRSKETKQKIRETMIELQGRSVKQYSEDGILIKKWDSIIEASRELNIDRANIGHCCSHKPNHNSAGGFIWRYSEDNTPVIKYTSNSVCQLDLEGNLIAIYKTAILAKEKTGVSAQSISHCCNGKIESVKGFVFIKYKDYKKFMNTQSVPAEMQLV